MTRAWFIALFGLLVLNCAEKPKYSAGRIALVTHERYTTGPVAGDRVLFSEKTEAFLTAAGFEIVEPQAGVGTIRVSLVAEPVLEKYGGGLEGYTGADVTIILELSDGASAVTDTFAGSGPPLDMIGADTAHDNPVNAPFTEAIERSGFFEGLAGAIGRKFGPGPLISAAVTKSVWVERGYRKIPFRIESYACAALRSITGKEYGDDAEVWDMWWKHNRGDGPSQ